jgi:hypothetical protein
MMDDEGGRWVSTEMGQVWQATAPAKRKQTPHSLLKHRCRNALTAWRQAHGVSVILTPSIVGRIKTMQGKEISVGKKGQSDDLIEIGKDGVLWGVIHAEYKAGKDRQSEDQKRHEEKCKAVGAMYVICRSPTDLTDALTQLLAQHGGLF